MNILFWVPYPVEGPSNRFRVSQYLPYLGLHGHQYRLRPFWNSRAYSVLYKKGRYIEKIVYFLCGIFNRFIDLFSIFKYNAIFIHREACPFGPPFFEWLVYKFKKQIIFDFDDAIFLQNVNPANSMCSFLKIPSKTKKIIKMSKSVIVANRFLEEYARRFNACVYLVPTPIDTEKFTMSKKDSGQIIIGWIGSPTTAPYLRIVFNVMQALSRNYSFVFKVIGAGEPVSIPGVKVENHSWCLEREVRDFQGIDIGIYPLADTLWAQGKAAFKAIQYMAVAVPVVASPVGMAREMIADNINGFMAGSEEEWIEKISRLIEDPELRKKIGLAGRKTVEEKFSVKVNLPRFLDAINLRAG